ncbi:MAG: hypothetical protein J5944_04550 [Lentisphaeria bacterium]|nr:hypothetical protein [Lentisphaeria bacterium]
MRVDAELDRMTASAALGAAGRFRWAALAVNLQMLIPLFFVPPSVAEIAMYERSLNGRTSVFMRVDAELDRMTASSALSAAGRLRSAAFAELAPPSVAEIAVYERGLNGRTSVFMRMNAWLYLLPASRVPALTVLTGIRILALAVLRRGGRQQIARCKQDRKQRGM